MQEEFKELTDALFKFLYLKNEASFQFIREHRREIRKIEAHFVPPGAVDVEVHFGFLKSDSFQLRGLSLTNLVFERLEFLAKELGIAVGIFDNELDFALHRFVFSKDRASFNLLRERRGEIKAVEEDARDDELTIKINFGLKKTKGFTVKGENEMDSALQMLFVLRNAGIHVERPRTHGGPLPKRVQHTLRATFG
jgi:hypothetical protein